MNRSLLLAFCVGFILFFTIPVFYLFDNSQSIQLTNQKVVYEMPYPGILPDHPLYFLKVVRDRIMEFGTRDHLKKAELYLLLSDKRVAMATLLVKKGKERIAVTTLSKGEKYALKIPGLLRQSKEQGVKPPDEVIFRVRLSNEKHREIIETLIKKSSQGELEALTEVLKLNEEIKKTLQDL